MRLIIAEYVKEFSSIFPEQKDTLPWLLPPILPRVLAEMIPPLGDSYTVKNGIAIHRTATVEKGAVLKAPVIISENCFVGSHAYLRGGVYLGSGTTIGTGCEVTRSIILHDSAVAHFNFVGDSIIGSYVNFEAGAVVANHYNERKDKQIRVVLQGKAVNTRVVKFGALVGDNCKIGANAVLSPGTILARNTVVKRLELVEQFTL
ncbi:DapH/DapD/GlmU-related protein [Pontibacter brevis]